MKLRRQTTLQACLSAETNISATLAGLGAGLGESLKLAVWDIGALVLFNLAFLQYLFCRSYDMT